MKIELYRYINPFRWVSLMFYFGFWLWKFPADFFDELNSQIFNTLNFGSNKTKEATKSIPMNDNVAKLIIAVLMLILIYIIADWLKRG